MTKHWWQQQDTQGLITWRCSSRLDAWLLQTLAQQGPAMTARFTTYYTQLRSLPRRVRRALGRRWAVSLAGVALLFALGQGPALAATLTVPCTDGVGDTAALIQAINTANNGTTNPGADTIELGASCVHTLTTVNNTTYGPNGLPLISSVITIQGNGSTIMRASGASAFRLFVLNGLGDLTLQDTTLSGGLLTGANDSGGAVLGSFGNVRLIDSTITGNSVDALGGGIYMFGGTLAVTNSTISGNSAGLVGGGITTHQTSSATITNSTISGNTSAYGGGVWWRSTNSATLINSTITNNTATTGGGGGVLATGSVATIFKNTIVSGNIASNAPERREVQIASAMDLHGDDFNLFGVNGAGGVGTPSGSLVLDTTDADSDGKVDFVPAAGVLIEDILAPLALNDPGMTTTHALVAGSPAIDAVEFGVCPPTDQRGVSRPLDGDGDTVARCDIGAFELVSPPPPELAHDLAVTNIIVPKVVTLTDARPTQTKTVRVQIQNRSAHEETIPDLGVLTELVSLDLISLGMCTPPEPTLVPPNTFPLTLRSKQKLNVRFAVTFTTDCVNDPAKSTVNDPGHEDYTYTATVDHSALDGGLSDDHPADDSCPRDPLGIDPNPDGKINDKGCAEDVTDVVVR